MENRKQQSGIDSVHDTSAFSWGLVVTVAAILAGAALSLLPGMGMSRMFSLELSASRWRLWF